MVRLFQPVLILVAISGGILLGLHSQPTGGNSPSEQLLRRYLAQDIFLQPGIGLKRVKIGDNLNAILKTWDNLKAVRELGGDIPQQQLTYQAESNTRIIISGTTTVLKIAVVGGPGSSYRTQRGAHFGMPLHQVALLYRGLGQQASSTDTLSYPSQGIYFGFKGGRLVSIIIVSPD